MINNILAVYAQATSSERQAGMVWYERANAIAGHLAHAHGTTLVSVAGAIAALSPRNRWERNLLDVAMLLQGSHTSGTFKACQRKAERIIALETNDVTEVLAILGPRAQKTRAFCRNIVDPHDDAVVTIDGHAANISEGHRRSLEATSVSPRAYLRYQAEYQQAARLAHVSAVQLQAITWVTWRRIHGI